MPPARATFFQPDRDLAPEPLPDGSSALLDWAPIGALPATLPDGRGWPEVAILVVANAAQGEAAAASAASVARQAYPTASVVPVAAAVPGALARAVERSSASFLLVLEAGDRLAPGALAALVLTAERERTGLVHGLRVLHDGTAVAVDMLEHPAGAAPDGQPAGDVLFSLAAIRAAGGVSPLAGDAVGDLWQRIAGAGARIARIGRPVLVRPVESLAAAAQPKPLRIAAINDAGGAGGAGIAHRRLVEALRFGGHDVRTFRFNDASPTIAAEWTDAFPTIEAAILADAPDWVMAGNLHGATRSLDTLSRLGAHVPVAAVLHDLFPLTGRCAHPDGCRLIVERGCDAACPTPDLYPQLAPSRIAEFFARKRETLASGTTLLANSDWTLDQAEAFAPDGVRTARIELAFPSQVFRPPADKAALRRRLGLPPDDVLILFGAVIADQPDKGGPDLAAALAAVAAPGIGFVAIGRIDDPAAFPLPNLVTPGPIADEAALAAWYGACDLHVIASRLETFGQTAVEAGLCGTPTIAYRLTGLTSAVIEGVSGLLVEPRPEAMAAAIRSLVADPERRAALGAWGRIALESRNSHAASYLSLREGLKERGLLPEGAGGRIRFSPDILRSFACSAEPLPGERGTVRPAPSRIARLARRLKQRIWGRAQPLWMRRLLYGAYRSRQFLSGARA
ncbi:glycosyltransferase [Enterovirga rhinocerotis]|uniref:Glycosyltransferase involved in cell wall biosynthesis n=1 Tax=Enterovirga rhinocerotis TaxID=1339210 RepID=A0A4R7CC61_9HYPH|nr:glycosyltransferase [Enterovirga rhinocerotis]TDR95045.1 glycosyltransferase involved in cell wall biosynthesis [Enterovirga rhinocerotis]